jgi:hypothetical protein
VAVAVRGGAVPGLIATSDQARTAAAWIEDYNHVRRHSALGMVSPRGVDNVAVWVSAGSGVRRETISYRPCR